MALNFSNNSNLEQLALKGLIHIKDYVYLDYRYFLGTVPTLASGRICRPWRWKALKVGARLSNGRR